MSPRILFCKGKDRGFGVWIFEQVVGPDPSSSIKYRVGDSDKSRVDLIASFKRVKLQTCNPCIA